MFDSSDHVSLKIKEPLEKRAMQALQELEDEVEEHEAEDRQLRNGALSKFL